ncbi:hypothetical protein KKH96_01465 [Patescibacteria group bacterium]|nr:hypothetical protein [Patescibacteria group bacterium]
MKKVKKVLILVILFTLIACISLASIRLGYSVRKGDSVYEIATKVFHIPWGDVRPEMRKKDTIHPGQQFSLSDLLDLTKEKIWKNFGINPFKKFQASSEKQLKRDKKGLEILGLNKKEVKEVMEKHQKFINKKSQEFRWGIIKTGDRFCKVLFGDFYIWRNVKVDWKNKCQAARIYQTSEGNQVWYPITCGNWALKEKKVFAMRPPPVPPIPPPPPVIGTKIRGILLAQYQKYRWDWDSTWGGFDESYRDGNHVRGWWQTSTFYPLILDDRDGNQWSIGLSNTIRRWKGATGEADPFHYQGDVDIWALAGRFRDTERKWEVLARAGIGQRKDVGYLVNKWGRYDAKQNVDLFNFYTSTEYNGRYDKVLFPKIRGSAEIELAYNDKKEDFWTDQWNGRQPQNGRPDDKNTYSGALYADVLSLYKKDFQIWSEARTTYYPEGYKWGNSIRGGLNLFNDSFKIGIGYTLWNNPNADSVGYYAETNLFNLYHRIFGYHNDSADERFGNIKQKEKEKEILELLTDVNI